MGSPQISLDFLGDWQFSENLGEVGVTYMAAASIKKREEEYYNYLIALYQDIPANKLKLAEGLLREAARLKVSLDDLWVDFQKHGNVRIDDDGYEKERPASSIFTSRDKSYRACIKHLDSLLPAKSSSGGLSKLGDDDDEDDE